MRRTPHDGSGRTGWIPQVELLKIQQSGQFPDDPAKIEVIQIHLNANSLCSSLKLQSFLDTFNDPQGVCLFSSE